MKVRRRARIAAFQALFEIDSVGHDPSYAIYMRLQEDELPSEGEAFCRDLAHGVLQHREVLDRILQRIAPEWPITQMAITDRNILRMAAFEVLFSGGTPAKVVINEAVELAKLFGSDSSGRFVNGVLGTLVAKRREFAQEASAAAPPTPRADEAGSSGNPHTES
ncbi:MAG: transcription antitermination factor NusB [Chloroflexi bacterium]|nr:transcription antitermination factor NusB [Chloroflexota bacterium]